MGDWISLIAGGILLVVSCMVMKAYWPRRRDTHDAAWFLGMAIFLGFLSAAANTLWWQIIVGVATHYGTFKYDALRDVGLYLDGALKGMAALAGAMHLVALHRKLSLPERRLYRWYDMPWYPRRWRMDSWRRTGEE